MYYWLQRRGERFINIPKLVHLRSDSSALDRINSITPNRLLSFSEYSRPESLIELENFELKITQLENKKVEIFKNIKSEVDKDVKEMLMAEYNEILRDIKAKQNFLEKFQEEELRIKFKIQDRLSKKRIEEEKKLMQLKIKEEDRLSKKRIEEEAKKNWEKDPRSMLCEFNSPIPVPSSNNFSGTFINRVSELNTAWEVLIYNWEIRNSDQKKPKLLITGQMSGSGKTTFGENILNFNDKHIAKEFENVPESPGKDALRSAIYIKINFQRIYITSQLVDIKQVISLNIWINVFENYFGVSSSKSEFFWSQKNYTLQQCIEFILEICQSPIFVHFDQLNYLEEPIFMRQIFPELYKNRTEKDLLLVNYEFWEAIYPLFQKGIFIYCTGKSIKLSERGRNLLGCNMPLCYTENLYLSAFTAKDVKDVMCYDKQILSSIIMSEIHDVAEWLHSMTSGVPRLVLLGIDAINQVFKNDKNVTLLKIKSHENEIVYSITKVPGIRPFLTELNKISNNIIPVLLLASQSELLFSLNEKIFGISDFTVQDLIEKFGFYVSAVSAGVVKILIPKIWKRSLYELGLPEKIFTSSLKSTYVDEGKALEVVIEIVLMMRSIARSEKTDISFLLPFLRNKRTFLSKSLIGKLVQIDCNFKITTQTTFDELKPFLMTKKTNDVLFKFKKKSSSMDLCIRLAYDEDEGLPMSLIAIQCKNVLAGFSLKNLKSEIKKVFKFINLNKSDVNTQPINCLFVLALTGSGTDDIERLRGEIVESTSELKLPDDMQVLVLSNLQMQDFIGSQNVQVLKKNMY